MPTDHHLLAQLLAYAALIAATAEYSITIRRRAERRAATALAAAAADEGLRGLVRVFLAEDGPEASSDR